MMQPTPSRPRSGPLRRTLAAVAMAVAASTLAACSIQILNGGAVVERGNTADVLRNPTDDYTIRLLDAIPNPRKVVA